MPSFTFMDRRWKVSANDWNVYFVGGPFSQWFRCSFLGYLPEELRSNEAGAEMSLVQVAWNSAEQFMMACKAALFRDWGILDKVIHSDDPNEQKQLGRKVRGSLPDGGWSEEDQELWRSKAREYVFQGNMLKFQQNHRLREYLFATGDKYLVEGAWYDEWWGVKLAWDDPLILDSANWKGRNWLGEVLMRVRKALYEELMAEIHPGHQR